MLVLIIMSALVFMLFKPFLSAILTAAVLAATFHSTYYYLLKKTNKKAISSLATCFLVLMIIVLPTLTLFGLVANEANGFYQKISTDSSYQNHVVEVLNNFKKSSVLQTFNLEQFFQQNQIDKTVQKIGSGVLTVIQKTYQNVVASILWIFVMFFSLYYFLIDGHRIIEKAMYLSPLKDKYEKELSQKFSSMVRATLKGTIIVGTIQGLLGGLMFAIVGVQSFVIWGVAMIILSIIPAIGSGLIWAPVGIGMLFMGNTWQGVVILVFGSVVISFIDNILRPKLVGNDTEMHPLLVFFATLGGLISFGIIGFIIGPVIMALFLALWEIYGKEFKGQLKKYNV